MWEEPKETRTAKLRDIIREILDQLGGSAPKDRIAQVYFYRVKKGLKPVVKAETLFRVLRKMAEEGELGSDKRGRFWRKKFKTFM